MDKLLYALQKKIFTSELFDGVLQEKQMKGYQEYYHENVFLDHILLIPGYLPLPIAPITEHA